MLTLRHPISLLSTLALTLFFLRQSGQKLGRGRGISIGVKPRALVSRSTAQPLRRGFYFALRCEKEGGREDLGEALGFDPDPERERPRRKPKVLPDRPLPRPNRGAPAIIPRDDPDLYDRDALIKRLRKATATTTPGPPPELELRKNITRKLSNLTKVMTELEAIMEGDPRNITILGTRHCNLLHQRIIELVSYALILTGNHISTSGGMGTNFVAIRGALRAENGTSKKLSVVLPQTLKDQPLEVQHLLEKVHNITELKRNDLPLDKASRVCNSELVKYCQELIIFAYHDSETYLDCAAEARSLDKLVTMMYLD
ncbi:hypothetical protein AAMO2058_001397300 [Amorphochlora amoebiformis]